MADAALRVLHAIGTSHVGGTERFLLDLVSRHNAQGITSAVCVLDSAGPLAAEYARVAVRVDHLDVSRNLLTAARRWRRVVSEFRPEVIVLYGARANALGRLVPAAGRRIPLIMALRSTVADEGGLRAARWMDRISFGRVAACVSNSDAALAALTARGYPADRLTFIPPGIAWVPVDAAERASARDSLAVSGDDLVVLSVANLKPVKQHGVLLDASRRLHAMGVAHSLWLVGDGPERGRLEQMARELGIAERVTFAGHVPEPRIRYAAADVFALTSQWEGTPMSVMEAMAAGLPVVAPGVGDIPAVVVDGVTGRLVDGHDPAGFAAALREALQPAVGRAWGSAAALRARDFSPDVAAARYAELFRWAARKDGSPVPVFGTATRPVRILRMLSRLNVGGPTLHVVLLTQALNGGRFATRLVAGTVGSNEGDMAYVAEERGVAVEAISELGRAVSPLRDLTALLKTVRAIRAFRPDIVHTHASKAGAVGRLAALLCNVVRPRARRTVVVHTYHGHTFEGYFGRFPALAFRAIEKILARATDIIIVLTESQRHDIVDRFRIVRADRVRIVPLGLDLQPFFALTEDHRREARTRLGLPASDEVIVAAGRLTAIKNLGLLIRAFARVAARRPAARLLLVGDGEQRAELERAAAALQVAERVSFLGWHRDMPMLYAAADVVALTSLNEGTPVALIEAIAAGCRAVATDVGGVSAVVDSSCGILVHPGMEEAISAALEDALDAGRLDTRARDSMRRFSVDRLAADLTRLYSEQLELRGSPRPKGARR